MGPIDIALWDIAGKVYDAPVYELLGGFRTSLPAYASTYHGDENGGLDEPRGVRRLRRAVQGDGLPGLQDPRLGQRPDRSARPRPCWRHARRVGDDMDLMLDPACEYNTWGDALKVGKACDEAELLLVRGPVQGRRHLGLRAPQAAPDHQDPDPARRARPRPRAARRPDRRRRAPTTSAPTPTTTWRHHRRDEDRPRGGGAWARLRDPRARARRTATAWRRSATPTTTSSGWCTRGLERRSEHCPVYADDYSDDLDAVDEHGHVPVPQGPGLGVQIDWDWVAKAEVGKVVYE